MQRVPYEGHSNQCQATIKTGQCTHLHVPESKYCEIHGGHKAVQAQEKQRIKMYQLNKFQTRVDEFAVNPKVKSLREEIGILRMTLEMLINRCSSETELIMFMPKISETIMKIEKLVTSAHRLESQMGQLLDKMAALQLSDEMVKIISENIQKYTNEILEIIPEKIKEDVEHILSSKLPNQIAEDMANTIAAIGEEEIAVV